MWAVSSRTLSHIQSPAFRCPPCKPKQECETLKFAETTGAIRLVAAAFPWARGSRFVHTRDNHTSVLGVREAALAAGATVTAVDPRRTTAGLAHAAAWKLLGLRVQHLGLRVWARWRPARLEPRPTRDAGPQVSHM